MTYEAWSPPSCGDVVPAGASDNGAAVRKCGDDKIVNLKPQQEWISADLPQTGQAFF
jgi:hypothetical protein